MANYAQLMVMDMGMVRESLPAPKKEPWQMTSKEFYSPEYWYDPRRGRHPASGSGRLPTKEVPYFEAVSIGGKQLWKVYNPYTKEEAYYEIAEVEKAKSHYKNMHRETIKKALEEGKPVPPEVLKEYPDLIVKKKEPWEMTYREFADYFEDVFGGQKFTFAERVGKPLGIPSQAGEPYKLIMAKRIGYTGSLPRDRWRRAIVEKALEQGKTVPDEVLADFPDLPKSTIVKSSVTVAKVQTPQDIKQQYTLSLQSAKSLGDLEQIRSEIAFLPLLPGEKNQLIEIFNRRYSALISERPFGVPIPKPAEKPRILGAQTPQQRFEEEQRIKAAQKRISSGQKTLTSAASKRLSEFGIGERAQRYYARQINYYK